MAAKIFICYRREVSDDFARDIARRCTEKYGGTDVFYDRHSLQASEDWKKNSRETAAQADLFLLIIGPNWLDCMDSAGTRRIDEIDDPVRLEIEAAMGGRGTILPIRHGNAEMPHERDLPATLVGLDTPNAFSITREYHDRDVETLFLEIDELLKASEQRQRIEEITRREKLQRLAASAQERSERFEHLLRAQGLSSPLKSLGRRIVRPYVAVPLFLFATIAFVSGWITHSAWQVEPSDLATQIVKLESSNSSLRKSLEVEASAKQLAEARLSEALKGMTKAEVERDLAHSQIAAKAECDRVARSPRDKRKGKSDAGVAFKKLKVADIRACVHSLDLDPNDPAQMFQLGRLLQKGKRNKEALDWYAKAAARGHALAQYNVGLMYQEHRTPLDLSASDPLGCKDKNDCDVRAVNWFAKAADQGNALAKVNLGLMYQNQRGVLKRQATDPLRCKDHNDCNAKALSVLQ